MLKKLFKYDFLWTMKTMPYYYIAVIVFGIAAMFTNRLSNANQGIIGWLIVDKIFSNIFISACFTAAITVFIRVFIRFRRNFYKDEAYLTHTLPVSPQKMFLSKVLSGIVCCVITALVIAAGICVTLSSVKTLDWFFDLIDSTAVIVALLLILEVLSLILVVYTAMVIANRFGSSKTLKGVLVAIGLYIGVVNIALISIAFAYFINPDIAVIFKTSFNSSAEYETIKSIIKLVCSCACVGYAVSDTVLYLIGSKLFSKGVNID